MVDGSAGTKKIPDFVDDSRESEGEAVLQSGEIAPLGEYLTNTLKYAGSTRVSGDLASGDNNDLMALCRLHFGFLDKLEQGGGFILLEGDELGGLFEDPLEVIATRSLDPIRAESYIDYLKEFPDIKFLYEMKFKLSDQALGKIERAISGVVSGEIGVNVEEIVTSGVRLRYHRTYPTTFRLNYEGRTGREILAFGFSEAVGYVKTLLDHKLNCPLIRITAVEDSRYNISVNRLSTRFSDFDSRLEEYERELSSRLRAL